MYIDFSNDLIRIIESDFIGNEAGNSGGAIFVGCKVCRLIAL